LARETTKDGNMPLQIAAWHGHSSTVKLLLQCAADANASDGRGETALICAAGQGHAVTAQILMEKKADPAKRAPSGLTPLEAAKEGRHIGVGKKLQEALRQRPNQERRRRWRCRLSACMPCCACFHDTKRRS